MTAPRVLMICPNGEFGGAERTAINFAETLNKRGKWECVVALLRKGPMEAELARRNIRYFVMPHFRLSRPLSWIRTLRELIRISTKENVQLIHSEMAYGHIIGSIAALFCRVPCLWYQHGPIDPFSWQQRLAAALPARGYLTNSRFSLSAQPRLLFSPKTAVLPPPLGEEFLHKNYDRGLRSRLRIAETEILILLAARFQQKVKGHLLALRGFAALAPKYPNAVLVLLGAPQEANHRDYGDYREIRDYADSLNAEMRREAVRILPFDANIIPYFDAADIAINTTLIPEGFGCTIVEAMSRNCMIVAGKAGGVLDIAENTRGLFLYEMGNEKNFQEKLAAAIQLTNAERKATAQALTERAREFRAETVTANLEKFYDQLVATSSSR